MHFPPYQSRSTLLPAVIAATLLALAAPAVSTGAPVGGTYMVGGQSWIVLGERWLRGPVLESGRFWEAAMPHMLRLAASPENREGTATPTLDWSVDDGFLKAKVDGKVTHSRSDGDTLLLRDGAKKQVFLVRMTFTLEPSSTINGDWDLVAFSADIKQKHGVRVWAEVFAEAASRLSLSDIDGIRGTFSNIAGELDRAYSNARRKLRSGYNDHIELREGVRLNSWLHRTTDPRVPRFLDNRMSREVTDEDLELIRAIHADAPHDPFLSLHATEMEALYGDLETAEEIWRQWLHARGDRGPDALRDALARRVERTVLSARLRARHPNLLHYADILSSPAAPHDYQFGSMWPDRVPEGGYGMLSLEERTQWLRRLGSLDTPTLRAAPILGVFGAEDSPLPGFNYSVPNFLSVHNAAKTVRILSAFDLLGGRRDESLETLMGIQYVGRSLACESTLIERLIGIAIQQISTAGLKLHLLNACETAAETEAFLGQLAHLRALDDALRFPVSIVEDGFGGFLGFVQSSVMTPNYLEAETRLDVTAAHFNLLEAAARAQSLRQRNAEAGRDRAPLVGSEGLPRDPFGEGKSLLAERGPVEDLYATFWSVGPDRADDDAAFEYDPTNGTLSPGDIVLRMPLQRRYPFPREGVRADSAFELLERFPNGMPLDLYNTVYLEAQPPIATVTVNGQPWQLDTEQNSNRPLAPPLSIVDATTTQPLRVFSPGPKSADWRGRFFLEPLPPVPTPRPEAIDERLVQYVIYPDTVLATPTPTSAPMLPPPGVPVIPPSVRPATAAGHVPPGEDLVFDPTPYDPTNGAASAGSLVLEISPR